MLSFFFFFLLFNLLFLINCYLPEYFVPVLLMPKESLVTAELSLLSVSWNELVSVNTFFVFSKLLKWTFVVESILTYGDVDVAWFICSKQSYETFRNTVHILT